MQSFLPLRFDRKQWWGPISPVMRVFFVIATLLFSIASSNDCSIPDTWNGSWFVDAFANTFPIIVDSTTNSIRRSPVAAVDELGECVWSSKEKDLFIFHDPEHNCEKCVLISQKHDNVLYSKEGFECLSKDREEWDNPMEFCGKLIHEHDIVQHFWFRSDFKAIECPFGDKPFNFSYRNSGSEKCQSPISHTSTCVDQTRVELHFEACHDQERSVAKSQGITCVGNWSDSGYKYLVADVAHLRNPSNFGQGPLQDRFRCFVFQEQKIPNPIPLKPDISIGFDIGTFEAATCVGLENPDYSETTLYFRNEEPKENPCGFPTWLSSHKWIDMHNTVMFEMKPQSRNTTIHVLPKRHSHLTPRPVTQLHEQHSGEKPNFFPLTHSTLVCLDKKNITTGTDSQNDSKLAVIGKYTVGCKTHEICLHIVQRSPHIFQIYYLELDKINRAALLGLCFNAASSALTKGATMVSSHEEIMACPHPRKYGIAKSGNLESASLKLPFKHAFSSEGEWSVGCENPQVTNVLPSPNSIETENFVCLDGWDEDQLSYTILAAASNDEHRGTFFCLTRNTTLTKKSKDDSLQTVIITGGDCIHVVNTNVQSDETGDKLINEEFKEAYFVALLNPASCNDVVKSELGTGKTDHNDDHDSQLDHLQDTSDNNNSAKTTETIVIIVPVCLTISATKLFLFSSLSLT